jgi:hypothetical protein
MAPPEYMMDMAYVYSHATGNCASGSGRLDRVGGGIARIKRRLDIVDAPAE